MKKYECKFPGCGFVTTDKSLIDIHHIVPKEQGGSEKPFNKIELCPNHHRRIYIKASRAGIHSLQHDDSIEILNILESSDGRVMHFKTLDDKEYSFYYRSKNILEWNS